VVYTPELKSNSESFLIYRNPARFQSE